MSELCATPATELTRRIAGREVSAVEVMTAHLARIHDVNPGLNAVVTLLPEEVLLAEAEKADRAVAAGDPLGPLHGLPVAHKDLTLTRGIRTTFGSPIFADFVPEEDALIVERLHAAGAITIGKTNTPEFGAGSQTFKPGVRPHQEPLGPDEDLRGEQRRRGGGARDRDGPDRGRQRLRRLAPQSGELLRGRRPSGPRPAGFRSGPTRPRGTRSRCRGRWREAPPTPRSC